MSSVITAYLRSPNAFSVLQIPLHLRTNWDSFYMEMLMLAGLGVYFLNFLAGKAKNSKLAQAWLTAHKSLLEENFHIVGKLIIVNVKFHREWPFQ